MATAVALARSATFGRVISVVEAAATLFLRTVSDLTEQQFRDPSLLSGWSRAHVIAHVALNAEGFVAVADAPDHQRPALMYPKGAAERDRDIATLVQASRSELLERAREASARFAESWNPEPSLRKCATAEAHPVFSSSSVMQRRLRELQVHLVDLGVEGVGIDAWLPEFVDADLELQWPTVALRTVDPVATVDERGVRWETEPSRTNSIVHQVPRGPLLAWVLDRVALDELPRLEPWSNRSKWESTSPSQ